MLKIYAAQKKIIVIAFLVVLVFSLTWIFIYSPSQKKKGQLKTKLFGIENQIEEIISIIGNFKTATQGRKLLEERLRQLDSKFPQHEEECLRMLSDLARKPYIDIISIRPQAKTTFLDTDSQKIEIEGKVCQGIFVTIEMRGSYKDLVNYLTSLEESLPAYITIERLRIKKEITGSAKLNIMLDLNLFLLS